jgi:hypothetical protein
MSDLKYLNKLLFCRLKCILNYRTNRARRGRDRMVVGFILNVNMASLLKLVCGLRSVRYLLFVLRESFLDVHVLVSSEHKLCQI